MQRVLIIGNSGAGKSTLALRLGELTGLPVVHLDAHFWQPGWVQTERSVWRRRVAELIAGPRWIIEGNYGSSLDIRLPRADTVIWLDFSTPICFWRAIKRVVTNFGNVRPDLAPGCPEEFDWEFLKWVWHFRKNERPQIVERIEHYFQHGDLIQLHGPKEVASYIKSISGGDRNNGTIDSHCV
jgi:adenylate kinase family enzyme